MRHLDFERLRTFLAGIFQSPSIGTITNITTATNANNNTTISFNNGLVPKNYLGISYICLNRYAYSPAIAEKI